MKGLLLAADAASALSGCANSSGVCNDNLAGNWPGDAAMSIGLQESGPLTGGSYMPPLPPPMQQPLTCRSLPYGEGLRCR